ncbi:HEPN domain-containing protein [Dyadobacter luticola]|uniref:HEPN domain-containing protein n=1 Tax=Dyadobacter luticola TaxID=1979387 RepID=A0A5R9KU76_9BACT|nr:HEPN domain-containing protein [Dyadobacter luticola]TLU99616.1 HEPN domain-containing protein [Dyadobacter luticola]
MADAGFDKNNVINYWINSSDEDFETMLAMFESKRYSWSLFIGHLVIEKLLKALYVNVNEGFPPFTHNLLRLAEKADIDLDDDQKKFLVSVTAFNINGRYDDYKNSFQKTCTPDFTIKWIEEI